MAEMEGMRNGGWEPLCNDHQGNLAEAPSSNVFFVKNGELITPLSDAMLPGITRGCVLEIAELHNIPVRERTVQREELLRGTDKVRVARTRMDLLREDTANYQTEIGAYPTDVDDDAFRPIVDTAWATQVLHRLRLDLGV